MANSAAPAQYRNSYANLPARYKKPRIEYRLDNERTIAADGFMKEFFAGLDYCESPEKVVMRAEMEAERRARAEAEAKSREISEKRDREDAERRKREEDERKLREKEQLEAMRAMLEAERRGKEPSVPKTDGEVSAVRAPMTKAESRDNEAPAVKSASGKYCKTCGALNTEGAKFCFSCSGTEFSQSAEKYCASCEHTNPINAKFCDSCGGKDFAFTREELREKISARCAKEEPDRIARYYVIDNGILKTLKDKNIKSADIPKNVTAIAKNVFADCRMLESVIIPEGVTSIGYEAFARCDKLT